MFLLINSVLFIPAGGGYSRMAKLGIGMVWKKCLFMWRRQIYYEEILF